MTERRQKFINIWELNLKSSNLFPGILPKVQGDSTIHISFSNEPYFHSVSNLNTQTRNPVSQLNRIVRKVEETPTRRTGVMRLNEKDLVL